MKKSVIFMPIYKMDGKKDGLQKYRVRINFTDSPGKIKIKLTVLPTAKK